MKKLTVLLIGICFIFPLKGQSNSDQKAIVMAHSGIILYLIDTTWSDWRGCYCYTSLITEGTKVKVDPGVHVFEFKHPKMGWNGRVYSLKFNAEAGKTYEISDSDTSNYFPMVKYQTDYSKVEDAIIKQISIPKPKSKEAKTLVLPSTNEKNYATLVSNCCNGLYDIKGNLLDLSYVIQLFKIDSIWGPYSLGFDVGYNNSWDGKINIQLPPGHHQFYLAVYPPRSFNGAVILSTNLTDNEKMKLANPGVGKKIICISADLESGKVYGFDYKMCFKTPKVSDDYYYDIKIAEAPGN